MKKFLVIISLALTNSIFANTISVYRFDSVDAVKSNGETISVEDLRDGFAKINGVQVNDESITVSKEVKAIIILRNSVTNKIFGVSTMAAKLGGDMGGG